MSNLIFDYQGHRFEFSALHKCIYINPIFYDANGSVSALGEDLDIIEVGFNIDQFELEYQSKEWLLRRK